MGFEESKLYFDIDPVLLWFIHFYLIGGLISCDTNFYNSKMLVAPKNSITIKTLFDIDAVLL